MLTCCTKLLCVQASLSWQFTESNWPQQNASRQATVGTCAWEVWRRIRTINLPSMQLCDQAW